MALKWEGINLVTAFYCMLLYFSSAFLLMHIRIFLVRVGYMSSTKQYLNNHQILRNSQRYFSRQPFFLHCFCRQPLLETCLARPFSKFCVLWYSAQMFVPGKGCKISNKKYCKYFLWRITTVIYLRRKWNGEKAKTFKTKIRSQSHNLRSRCGFRTFASIYDDGVFCGETLIVRLKF